MKGVGTEGPVVLNADDRFRIQDLLARYNWAVDTDDADAFATSFATDGEFVTDRRVFRGHDELRELMAYLHDKRSRDERSLFHSIANLVVEPYGPEVRLVAQMMGPRINDDGTHVMQLGWYDDRLTRTDDGWRFARRHFRHWPDHAPSSSPVPFWSQTGPPGFGSLESST